MDLCEFNLQDLQGRATLIWKHGNFIEFREEEDSRIALYDMGSFFSEIWFDAEMRRVKKVIGFKSLQGLEPYLNSIIIDK
ncbi:hypothetical protein AAE02nite_31230 [Adhaeribacter aerolatus]|uniref:Uncharacterized protein n=1 Tax=Adhaeribacter aerolatus TaxID=670289 RepID=A0A512B0H3_9BACT|nr:hypothetical protein AAE02nite_31230 [Adhaeribacter aerolatus]